MTRPSCRVTKAVLRFFGLLFAGLMVIAFVPEIALMFIDAR